MALLLNGGPAFCAKAPGITGTFIQLQQWMLDINADGWKLELDAVRKAGMDTIILQWLKYDQTRFYPVNTPGNDPADRILSYADRHGMKVMVGVLFDSAWWKQWDDEEYLDRLSRKSKDFAAKIWERYGFHPSFAGWYLPFELSDSDFDDEEIAAFARFFKNSANGCRRASGRKKLPVAFSSFFTGKIPPASVEGIYTKLLSKAGLDIMIVQDGVGANSWRDVETSVTPYLNAFLRAARKTRVRTWGALEVFSTDKSERGKTTPRIPAPMEMIQEQITVMSPLVEKTVMFDFFHYMSPQRGVPQAQLYERYLETRKLSD